ncbi:hypothetical protein TL16_g09473 [Triparma laevis f. inornata]|uniref:Uncharacterized protein n=1 Tax=Triparma laevis f. inornata TaxID=1714386 RepID=A0A9W7B7W0_9STRA|nr:hypothetical protein TL16_g09473 [Triparma laevis f. inornata]
MIAFARLPLVTKIEGYFVLGPTELYKLTKEIGKFVNNFRSVGTELTGQFTDSMENQLALDEVRKAQEDLTEAFSFRRSINWEEENEGVNENVENFREVEAEASAATATATATATASTTAAAAAGTGKKKIRKRVKKREPVPLETVAEEKIVQDLFSPNLESSTEEDARVEDMISNSGYIVPDSNDSYPDLDVSSDFTDSDNTTSSTMLESRTSRLEASENSRFAAQLNSEAWNESIIENEDALSPLSKIMEKLALLEDERNANLKRLEEEMRLKEEVEERFYREKRKVLEEGIEEFQRSAMLEEEVGESNIV